MLVKFAFLNFNFNQTILATCVSKNPHVTQILFLFHHYGAEHFLNLLSISLIILEPEEKVFII